MEVMTTDNIKNCVYCIRGQQVMLDQDLAEIYGYEVKRLNEQVKRNITRFPEDFMFELTDDEVMEISRSQIATLKYDKRRGKNIKYNPHAFTEQGIYMLATVLRGELAEQQSIFIMRMFREMRHYINQNQQFVSQSEMYLVTTKVSELSAQMAGVVDDYVNVKTLQLLSQKKSDVEVTIFTENGHGRNGFLTSEVINDFNQEYSLLRIKPNPTCHDRLIVLDYGFSTEQVYHCGASSKDAGNKLCAINKIYNTAAMHSVIDDLIALEDKRI